MDVLAHYASAELHIKNSRFLAEIIPVTGQNEAREQLKAQKEKYFDATHVVHAFIVGKAGEIMGMSDDGEPAGTAGRPVLDVLKGRNCTNILLTVTRWFGGTLLGTGGLVKAYGDSAKAVLDKGIYVPLIERRPFSFSLEYDLYNQVKRFLSDYDITEEKEDFGTDIHLSGLVPQDNFDAIQKYIISLTKGKVSIIEP